jgi:hypothetical protein
MFLIVQRLSVYVIYEYPFGCIRNKPMHSY